MCLLFEFEGGLKAKLFKMGFLKITLDLGRQNSNFGPTLSNSCCLKRTLNILQMKILVALWLMMMVQLCAHYAIKG